MQGDLPFILRIFTTMNNSSIELSCQGITIYKIGHSVAVDLDWTFIGQRYKMSQKYIHTHSLYMLTFISIFGEYFS